MSVKKPGPKEDGDESPKPKGRHADRMSKVKDLLRESRTNAFNMNRSDLDTMFNLPVQTQEAEGVDKTSLVYLEKISQLREM